MDSTLNTLFPINILLLLPDILIPRICICSTYAILAGLGPSRSPSSEFEVLVEPEVVDAKDETCDGGRVTQTGPL